MPEGIVYVDCFSSADELSEFEDTEQSTVAATNPIETPEQPLEVSARQAAATTDQPNTDLQTTRGQSDTADTAEEAIEMLSLNETRHQEAAHAGEAVRERYREERHYRRAVASDQAWRNIRPMSRFDGTMGLDKKTTRKQLRHALLAMMEMCPNDKKFKFYLETCFIDGARMWVVTWAASRRKWDPKAFEEDFCKKFLPDNWNEGLLNELRLLRPTNGAEIYVRHASRIIQAMDPLTSDKDIREAFLQFAPEAVLNSVRADYTMTVDNLMKAALVYHSKLGNPKTLLIEAKKETEIGNCRECCSSPHVCKTSEVQTVNATPPQEAKNEQTPKAVSSKKKNKQTPNATPSKKQKKKEKKLNATPTQTQTKKQK